MTMMTRGEAVDFISTHIMWGKYKEGEPGEALSMAIRSLEAWDKVVDELLHIDKPTDFGGYEDGAYNGVTLAIRTINKHLSEVEG